MNSLLLCQPYRLEARRILKGREVTDSIPFSLSDYPKKEDLCSVLLLLFYKQMRQPGGIVSSLDVASVIDREESPCLALD